MLTVYVFTAGQTTREVFNAVAAFMNTDGFSKAMSIGVMLSIVGCAIQYIRSHDLMQLLKWFGIYFSSAEINKNFHSRALLIATPLA